MKNNNLKVIQKLQVTALKRGGFTFRQRLTVSDFETPLFPPLYDLKTVKFKYYIII